MERRSQCVALPGCTTHFQRFLPAKDFLLTFPLSRANMVQHDYGPCPWLL
jgi:hypothetical protein